MRQIGSLPSERAARRFAAYLTTLLIDVEAELEGDAWVIWVRDEDRVDAARDELQKFLAEPDAARYEAAGAIADRLRRKTEERQREAAANTVDMSRRWARGRTRRHPLVSVLTILCVSLYILLFWNEGGSPLLTDLTFGRYEPLKPYPVNGWEQIAQGEIWRLVTPALLHFSIGHLLFNMLALRYLGGMIEQARGTPRFGMLCLFLAIGSNVAQYTWTRSPEFGGISGVIFGLFGYAWMMSIYRPQEGMNLSAETVIVTMAFFVLCMLRDTRLFGPFLSSILPPIANACHAGGLVLGIACGFIGSHLRAE